MPVGDWVPMPAYGTSILVTPGSPLDTVLVSPRDEGPTAVGEVGVVETQNEVITERTVGQVHSLANEDGGGILIERIRVGLLDDAGLAAFYADSFLDASEANEPFLWQRVTRFLDGQNNVEPFAHPFYSVVDVKVARKLQRDQALFYSVQAFGEDTRITVTPFLRTWARIVNRR